MDDGGYADANITRLLTQDTFGTTLDEPINDYYFRNHWVDCGLSLESDRWRSFTPETDTKRVREAYARLPEETRSRLKFIERYPEESVEVELFGRRAMSVLRSNPRAEDLGDLVISSGELSRRDALVKAFRSVPMARFDPTADVVYIQPEASAAQVQEIRERERTIRESVTVFVRGRHQRQGSRQIAGAPDGGENRAIPIIRSRATPHAADISRNLKDRQRSIADQKRAFLLKHAKTYSGDGEVPQLEGMTGPFSNDTSGNKRARSDATNIGDIRANKRSRIETSSSGTLPRTSSQAAAF
jgi:hypothetical protein